MTTEKTVADVLGDNIFTKAMEADVLTCPADSCVGELCVKLAQGIAATIAAVYACDDGQMEADVRDRLAELVAEQCNVWYFG